MALACRRAGILLFAFLLIALGAVAHYTVMLLMRVVDMLGLPHAKYPDLGRALYGQPGRWVSALAVILQQLGACTAYVVIVADVLMPILGMAADSGDSVFCKRWVWQLLIVVFVIFPLCLLRDMDSLKYTSLVALAFIMAFAAAIFVTGTRALADAQVRLGLYKQLNSSSAQCGAHHSTFVMPPGSKISWWPGDSSIISSVSFITFSFLCHMNSCVCVPACARGDNHDMRCLILAAHTHSFPIYAELKGATIPRMTSVSKWAVAICGVVYFCSGLFGYLAFLDSTQDNIMLNFPASGSVLAIAMDLLRAGFGVALVFSYPVIVYEARHSLDDLLFPGCPQTTARHVALNVGLVAVTCTLGIVLPKIEVVFSLVGSTCSPIVVFILPALFYLKASPAPAASTEKVPAWLVLAYGVLCIPISVGTWASTAF